MSGCEVKDEQREAVRKLHCVSCYDVIRSRPKFTPCRCSCHAKVGAK